MESVFPLLHCILTLLHYITITWSETVLPTAADFTGLNSWPDLTLACSFQCKQRRPICTRHQGNHVFVTLWLMVTVRNSICESWLKRQRTRTPAVTEVENPLWVHSSHDVNDNYLKKYNGCHEITCKVLHYNLSIVQSIPIFTMSSTWTQIRPNWSRGIAHASLFCADVLWASEKKFVHQLKWGRMWDCDKTRQIQRSFAIWISHSVHLIVDVCLVG